MKLQVPCVLVRDEAGKYPLYMSPGASGFDLISAADRHIELAPGMHHTIPTGIALQIPEGYEVQVRSRSGLVSKHGIEVILGTVDSDYRGEIMVHLVNRGKMNYVIAPGARIAQGVLAPVAQASFQLVTELEKTQRGKNGHGSTGY